MRRKLMRREDSVSKESTRSALVVVVMCAVHSAFYIHTNIAAITYTVVSLWSNGMSYPLILWYEILTSAGALSGISHCVNFFLYWFRVPKFRQQLRNCE